MYDAPKQTHTHISTFWAIGTQSLKPLSHGYQTAGVPCVVVDKFYLHVMVWVRVRLWHKHRGSVWVVVTTLGFGGNLKDVGQFKPTDRVRDTSSCSFTALSTRQRTYINNKVTYKTQVQVVRGVLVPRTGTSPF